MGTFTIDNRSETPAIARSLMCGFLAATIRHTSQFEKGVTARRIGTKAKGELASLLDLSCRPMQRHAIAEQKAHLIPSALSSYSWNPRIGTQ